MGARSRLSGRHSFVRISVPSPARRPPRWSPLARVGDPALPEPLARERCGRLAPRPQDAPSWVPEPDARRDSGLPRGELGPARGARARAAGAQRGPAEPLPAAGRPGPQAACRGRRPPPPNPQPGPIAGKRGPQARPRTTARGPTRQEKVGVGGCQSFGELLHLRFRNPAVPPTESGGRGGRAPPTTLDCGRRRGPGGLER